MFVLEEPGKRIMYAYIDRKSVENFKLMSITTRFLVTNYWLIAKSLLELKIPLDLLTAKSRCLAHLSFLFLSQHTQTAGFSHVFHFVINTGQNLLPKMSIP